MSRIRIGKLNYYYLQNKTHSSKNKQIKNSSRVKLSQVGAQKNKNVSQPLQQSLQLR